MARLDGLLCRLQKKVDRWSVATSNRLVFFQHPSMNIWQNNFCKEDELSSEKCLECFKTNMLKNTTRRNKTFKGQTETSVTRMMMRSSSNGMFDTPFSSKACCCLLLEEKKQAASSQICGIKLGKKTCAPPLASQELLAAYIHKLTLLFLVWLAGNSCLLGGTKKLKKWALDVTLTNWGKNLSVCTPFILNSWKDRVTFFTQRSTFQNLGTISKWKKFSGFLSQHWK